MPLASWTLVDGLRIAAGAFGALAGTASVYNLLLAGCATRFRSSVAGPTDRARVSVLVPVCGNEPRLRANLEALIACLDAGDELLVASADANDPAAALAREVARDHSAAAMTVVAGSASRATNRKVAALEAIEPLAKNPTLVIVDSDVTFDPGLLLGITAPLADPKVGIATALYRGVPAGSLASRLEALQINADFVPSVLVANALGGGIRFGLGAANAVRREALDAIGGIGSLGQVLADDHHLGKRIAAAGWGVRIAPACVPIRLDSSLEDTLARVLRWNRTVRVCQPLGYAATLFSHHGVAAALIALGLAAVAQASGAPLLAPFAIAAGLAIALRVATAAVAHTYIAGRGADLGSLPLLPARDVLASALFVLAWCGRTVTWRGRTFRVAADGTMVELGTPRASRALPQVEPSFTAGGS